jgi:muramoyltetrapeptide carboxypeptidase
VGTPWGIASGTLLFLEEIGESAYRIDRMLTQLAQSGVLGAAPDSRSARSAMRGEPRRAVVHARAGARGHFAPRKQPSMYGLSFGHIPPAAHAAGGRARALDTRERTLTLLETAVT